MRMISSVMPLGFHDYTKFRINTPPRWAATWLRTSCFFSPIPMDFGLPFRPGGLLQDSRGQLGCGALTGTPTGTGGTFGVDVSCAQAWGTNVGALTSEWTL